MSWRQDNINLGGWNQFNEDPNLANISYLQNDFEHMQQPTKVPISTARADQSNYMSFDQVLGQDHTFAAPGTFRYESNPRNDPSNMTRSSLYNTPLFNNDSSDHTVSPPVAKHRSIKSKAGHTEGSKIK